MENINKKKNFTINEGEKEIIYTYLKNNERIGVMTTGNIYNLEKESEKSESLIINDGGYILDIRDSFITREYFDLIPFLDINRIVEDLNEMLDDFIEGIKVISLDKIIAYSSSDSLDKIKIYYIALTPLNNRVI